MTMKVDYKKMLKQLYNPQTHGFHYVDVPCMNFLFIDGAGDPSKSVEYQQAVESLYSIAYGIKFATKSSERDYVVPPLEGLWWMENMDEFNVANKYRWEWTMMIMQPEWITPEIFDKVRNAAYKKKKLESMTKVRFDAYQEGLCIQIVYTGAYIDEGPTIAEMHRLIKSNGYRTNGKHHEIYLGDPRKTPAEKLLTLLRQPVVKA